MVNNTFKTHDIRDAVKRARRTRSANESDATNDRLDNIINNVTTTLDELTSKVATISEGMYMDKFLFMHHPDLEEKEYARMVNEWITLAGGPYKSVKIVDNNKNVVFTCPPLYNSSVFTNPKLDTAEIGETYELKKQNTGANSSNEYLSDSIMTIAKHTDIHINDDDDDTWERIVEYYSKKVDELNSKPTNEPSVKPIPTNIQPTTEVEVYDEDDIEW